MKTILATVYAVNPYKGSEDGMGWNFVCQIARFNKVIAITRENNRPHIEKYMHEHPSALYENMHFLYFDLPYWMRFWKKGSRGAMLYYWMWQKGIVSFIRKQNLQFDIVHNVNFHNNWTPSYLWKLNKPFVWGPVGHHPRIPSQYLSLYAFKYAIIEQLTWIIKCLFWKFSPALKKTSQHASHILCMNKSAAEVLHLPKEKYSIIPSVATQDFGFKEYDPSKKFTLISAGRLVPLKGFDLTINAFADFLSSLDAHQISSCELKIVGTGPELTLYKKMATELGIQANVSFIEWVERDTLMNYFKDASGFVFPSHEGAGMVVAEALSFGLPVICLDNSGPGEFIHDECGFKIPVQGYQNTVREISHAMYSLYFDSEKMVNMRIAARKRFETHFNWDIRGQQLNAIYNSLQP